MNNVPQKQSRQGYLVATNIKEARDVAEIIANTDFLPRSYKDSQGKPKINEIIIAGNMGARHGWDMFQSIQAICVINNRPSIWGEYFWGLILSDPRFIKCKETWNPDIEGGQWVVEIWKTKSDFPVVGTFGLQDAATAGLLSDKNKTHTWGKYPKDMCLWRARGRAGKSGFADAIQGFAMVEEQRDVVDVTYQAVEENKQIERTSLERAKEDMTQKTNKFKQEKDFERDHECQGTPPSLSNDKKENSEEDTKETPEEYRLQVKKDYDSLNKENRLKTIEEFTGIKGQSKISVNRIPKEDLLEFQRIVLFNLEIQAKNPVQEQEKTLSVEHVDNIREKAKKAWLCIVDTSIKEELKKRLNSDLVLEELQPLDFIVVVKMDVPTLLVFHRILKEQGIYGEK